MRVRRAVGAFTLIELLIVIVVLAILTAIAIGLYLRAVGDSERQTCRSNMQAIAHACEAGKVRNASHRYPGNPPAGGGPIDLSLLTGVGANYDLGTLPRCSSDHTLETPDYTAMLNADGTFTISCDSDSAPAVTFHHAPGRDGAGYTLGADSA